MNEAFLETADTRAQIAAVTGNIAQMMSGLGRAAGETVMAWLARIEAKLPPGFPRDTMREIAVLHYRYRFDPAGLPSPERARLRELALGCLGTVSREA